MAKRKRRTATRRRRSTHLSARPKHHVRRRRRMSAGGGMGSIFKILSDPLIGGLVGAAGGIILKNTTMKMMKGNKMIAAGVPLVVAFLAKKKMPFVAAGMAGATGVALLAEKITFLKENDNINFVSEQLLADDSPLFLDEEGEPLYLSGQEYMLEDSNDGFYLSDDQDDF